MGHNVDREARSMGKDCYDSSRDIVNLREHPGDKVGCGTPVFPVEVVVA